MLELEKTGKEERKNTHTFGSTNKKVEKRTFYSFIHSNHSME